MAVRTDCRHYSSRSVSADELVQRCRVKSADTMPFACPDGGLFYEPRSITDAGWDRRPDER